MNIDRRTYLKRSLFLAGSLLLPAGVVSLVGRHGISDSPELIGFDGKIMGTGYSIRLGPTRGGQSNPDVRIAAKKYHSNSDQNISALANQVHSLLQAVDTKMSTWRTQSELSVFNNSLNQDWHTMSPSTLSVIAHANQISHESTGAFDLTVGPLVDLWGFGAIQPAGTIDYRFTKPSEPLISNVMQRVGYRYIEIDHAASAIRKSIPDVRLDLSGIAKGFAVDQIATLLDELGYQNYLVEVGGELRSRGEKSDNNTWKVAIERPTVSRQDVFRVLSLKNRAIATSGDYRNFYTDNGQRYSHSINPRTGRPVTHEMVSVSVIADSTMQADALSTALIVLGPDEALAFGQKYKVGVHFILKSASGKLIEQFNPLFGEYIV